MTLICSLDLPLQKLAALREGYARTPEYCAAWQEAEALEAEYTFLVACWKNGLGDDEGLPAAHTRWSTAVSTIPPHLVPKDYKTKLFQIETYRRIKKDLSRAWADFDSAARMTSSRGIRAPLFLPMDYITRIQSEGLEQSELKMRATPLKMRQQPPSLISYSMGANPLRLSETYGKTYVDDSGT